MTNKKDFVGKTVRYNLGVGAFSCYTNGRRIKGIGKVTDIDIAGDLCINGYRVFQHEIVEVLDVKEANNGR